jgi:hypothetical protein
MPSDTIIPSRTIETYRTLTRVTLLIDAEPVITRRPVDGVGCAADLYCRDKLLTIVAQPEGKLTLTEQYMDSWEPRPLFTGSDNPEDWETLVKAAVGFSRAANQRMANHGKILAHQAGFNSSRT